MHTTYQLGLKYELARELINARISEVAAELGVERAKVPADAACIEKLREKMQLLVVEREGLRSDDEAAVLAAVQRHKRHHEVTTPAEKTAAG